MSPDEAADTYRKDARNADVLFPVIKCGRPLLATGWEPSRWIINFLTGRLRTREHYPRPVSTVETDVSSQNATAELFKKRNALASIGGNMWRRGERLYETISAASASRHRHAEGKQDGDANLLYRTGIVFSHSVGVIARRLRDYSAFSLRMFIVAGRASYGSTHLNMTQIMPLRDCFETFPFPVARAGDTQ